MLDRFVSNSNADPTIVDEVRDARSDIKSDFSKLLAALANGNAEDSQEFHVMLDDTLSQEHCNLFIIKDIRFDSNRNCFTIPRSKALRHRSSEKYDVFDEAIRKFPALFITTNGDYRKCKDQNQKFYYGIVMEVAEQGKRAMLSL